MNWLLVILAGYLAIGLLFGVAFVTRGLVRLDGNARGAGWWFRLVVWPGTAALWPVLAMKWLGAGGATGERIPRDTRAHRRVHVVVWCVLVPLGVAIVAWGWFGGVDPTGLDGVRAP